jgi:hypothetical protein
MIRGGERSKALRVNTPRPSRKLTVGDAPVTVDPPCFQLNKKGPAVSG